MKSLPIVPACLFALPGLLLSSALPAAAPFYRLTLPAPSGDRVAQVVSFAIPEDAVPPLLLRDAMGMPVALQVIDGRGTFMIPSHKGGVDLEFTLLGGVPAVLGANDVAITATTLELALTVRGQDALRYRLDKTALPRSDIDPVYQRAGYLHPVFSPTGRIITGDYPANHVHHHGIWSPWTRTRFQDRTPDFWNMGKRTGTVEFIAVDRMWSGPVHAGFVSRHHMDDLSGGERMTALNETWEVTLYDAAGTPVPARVFDLTIRQTCASPHPLELLEYHYGGLGFRGRDEWNGESGAHFLTSEGETDRVKAHATRARWCYIGGEVEGGPAGIAILCHPANFRAPEPMRIHPNEPFFCYAPSQLGDFAISPGEPYTARYRFVVTDGPPDASLIEAFWRAFADDPVVAIAPLGAD